MSKYIYLCGQITGLSYEDARYGWRAQVFEALQGTGITCLSPMRGKDNLEGIKSLDAEGDPDSVMSCASGITTRDFFDVSRSDAIFCNLVGMTRVSVGSMIEFGWAHAQQIPIIACMEDGNPHEHAMVDGGGGGVVGWRCRSLEEGIAVVKRVLQEGL